jgi:GTP-binding protein HflX
MLIDKSNIRVLLVCVNFNRDPDFDDLVAEGEELVHSAEYKLVHTLTTNRTVVDRKSFIGSGKVEEIKALCAQLEIDMLVVNHNLTPLQERNLSESLDIDIRDRTCLILDIFSLRTKSNEGVLQVELAQQTYMMSRLIGRWTHLERQRGGTGTIGGAGEKQLELDKRFIRDKIHTLKTRLTAVVKQRETQRKSRNKNGVFSVSVVGYTNAGKSTMFNALTNAGAYAENRLFATLQTTSRKLYLAREHEVIISDTVGFIRNLSHNLVAAFRATLEETVHANLLLNVVDVSQRLKERQIEDVKKVLSEIDADTIPSLIVYNKIDLIGDCLPKIEYNNSGEPIAVYLSAVSNLGLDLLKQAILEKMAYSKLNLKKQELVYEPWKN